MKSIQITPQIRAAVAIIRQRVGTNKETGELLGFSGKHIGDIVSGKTLTIHEDRWQAMEPILRPHLKTTHELPVVLNNGEHGAISKIAAANGKSVKDYIQGLILDDIERAKKYSNTI